jgi:hypothetical protein
MIYDCYWCCRFCVAGYNSLGGWRDTWWREGERPPTTHERIIFTHDVTFICFPPCLSSEHTMTCQSVQCTFDGRLWTHSSCSQFCHRSSTFGVSPSAPILVKLLLVMRSRLWSLSHWSTTCGQAIPSERHQHEQSGNINKLTRGLIFCNIFG